VPKNGQLPLVLHKKYGKRSSKAVTAYLCGCYERS
jgi:hypothetical protein